MLELEDEKLASADSITMKKHFFKETTHCSDIIDMKCNNNVWNSIRIVVFSTKLNILMIFGPAAIFVEKATGYHVSFLLISFSASISHIIDILIACSFRFGVIVIF